MQKCMTTDRPKVTVVMAVYRPNEPWLVEQLKSLNQQSYKNMEILIWDDCPSYPVEEHFLIENITNFPYTLYRGKKNMGSNGAFEELTKRVQSPLISYCDQDDIWEKTKVEEMVSKLMETGAVLVCSDLTIIDAEGNKTAGSITEIRKRHIFKEGTGLAPSLMVTNFVVGCAMMMKTETAKRAVPFEPYFIHDQWLATCAALEGSIAVIRKPLIRYRQHSSNQTGILAGVQCKQDYYQIRIVYMVDRLNSLKERFRGNQDAEQAVEKLDAWVNARAGYYKKPNRKDAKIMRSYKEFGKTPVFLELFLPVIPEFVFKWLVNMVRRSIL